MHFQHIISFKILPGILFDKNETLDSIIKLWAVGEDCFTFYFHRNYLLTA